MMANTGQVISHYEILEKLGEGGMGVVYKARDLSLARIIALKFLPSHLTGDANEKERFRQEARAAAALTHNNVGVIYEIGEHEGQIFIAMEFVEGMTLKALIEREGRSLPLQRVLDIAIQMCEGLSAAHEKGIVHRDIKSDNIMLTPKGQVKIMDFGLAKLKGATSLTQAGSTVGTAAYMSPEQAQGEGVDQRSDIFSLGVVLYEMMTTRLPFRGEHQAAVVYSLINEDPQPIARFNDKVSADLERIVAKALAKDRDERYQHVDDMLADLRRERKNIEYARTGYVRVPPAHQETPAALPRSGRGRVWKIFVPSILLIVMVALFLILNPLKLQVLEKQERRDSGTSLAVMYFENIPDPGDKEHAGEMLTNLLITSLSQVKGLEVISRERLLDIQKDLGQADAKNISASFANQVAKRAGVTMMLVGSILEQEPTLAVTTRLIDVQSGKILGSQQITGVKSSQIFAIVDSLSSLIQSSLPSASGSPAHVKSVAEVTTKSPEAYRAYVAGLELRDKIYINEAIAAFTRAIELDKSFAMAYFHLSEAQSFSGFTDASQASLTKAVELADRATEDERLQIVTYNDQQQNNLSKAAEGYEEILRRDPHDIGSYVQLGFVLYGRTLLVPEKGLEVLQSGLHIEPSAKPLWNTLGYTCAWLGRRGEALDAVNRYINLAPAEPNPYDTQGDLYVWFQEYDSSSMSYQKAVRLRGDFNSNAKLGFYSLLRQHDSTAGKYFQACDFELPFVDAYRGHLGKAGQKMSGLPESQIPKGNRLRTMTNYSYESGEYPEMLRVARDLVAASKKDPSDVVHGRDYLAWALAKNGKQAEAQTMLDEIQHDVGSAPSLAKIVADYASALVLLEEGQSERSVDQFRRVFQALAPNHEPNIFFGVACLKAGQSSEAAEEMRKLLYWPQNNDDYVVPGIPGADLDWPVPAVKAHYWLGVAYEREGRKEEAMKEYGSFLDIWRDADFRSNELTDARQRLAALKGVAAR